MTLPGTEPAEGEVLLGQYRLDRLIGRGGMGKVFRAENLQNGSLVAVKILSATAHDEESRRRFAREATIMARLDHPNLIRLFGHGEERGFPFLVMRFLEGKNLLDTLETTTGRLGVAEALDVIGQLAAALDHLHGQGILHRDLKLSNIFQGPDGKVTLLDMGLARGIPSTTQLTRVGVIWGTPEFMSPEQILGETRLDGRADVYGLAGIFFRILSGRLAFNPGDEQKLLEAHVRAPRPDLKAAVPSIPAAVAEVVKQAMAVRREERYATAGQFHEALKAAFAGLPAPMPGESTVVARPSRDLPPPVSIGIDGKAAVDADEPMTLPGNRSYGPRGAESPSDSHGPETLPPSERTQVTAVTQATALGQGTNDDHTAVTDFRGGLRGTSPATVLPTNPSTEVTGSHQSVVTVATDPGSSTEAVVLEPTMTPQGAITASGRGPRGKDIQRSNVTLLDDDQQFMGDLPEWATPAVMAAIGAGLLATGFLLGLLFR